ncbi:unnamed protein product, partial [marine sediment metagenome]
WTFIKHNPGIIIGAVLAAAILIWTYGCQTRVVSIVNNPQLVTRPELQIEVEHFLAQKKLEVDTFISQAELKFEDLDRQDELRNALFGMALTFMQGGQINPAAVALVIGSILGLGATVDNIRKRTVIATLKGQNAGSVPTS